MSNHPTNLALTRSGRHDGPAGPMEITALTEYSDAVIDDVLVNPVARIPAPTKPSQERKLLRRRAVHSFPAQVAGKDERLYLKIYRVRSIKDIFEELLLGKRADRSFRAALAAKALGIPTPTHLGWSSRAVARRWPAQSALLMIGLPQNRDVRTLLDPDTTTAASRARAAGSVGHFLGDVHRRGLIHGDLKLGNVFVLNDRFEYAVIDLDRARFRDLRSDAIPIGQLIDLRTLLRSIRRSSRRERFRVLAGWIRGRRLSRKARPKLLRWLALLGAWAESAPKVNDRGVQPPSSGS